jgi:nicotinate-nucleotide pyrophosphorylase (carboxylating)
MQLDPKVLQAIVVRALDEDLGRIGDLTSDAVIPAGQRSVAAFVARQPLTLAGVPVAREVYRVLDAGVRFAAASADGDTLTAGATVARVEGPTRSILRGERTALNFLTRMCGIATTTRRAVEEIRGTPAKILDTRKTAPGLRQLDKYAVSRGGGSNHRMGLFDAVMIKDTHLAAGYSIGQAVRRALGAGHAAERVTAEVRTLEQLAEAIEAGAGRALLDNMPVATIAQAVRRARGRIVLEASGGLRPGSLRSVAETGVDFLSLGWLTHSAPAADLAMELEAPS